MATVQEVLHVKGDHVQTIGPGASVLEAAELMNERQIGCLVVTVGKRVQGIFTERDILRRVVAVRRDPGTTRVEAVMTENVYCCGPQTSLDDVRSVMMNRRIRHVPVVDEERRLCGLISIGDLNAHLVSQQQAEIQAMQQYIQGPA